MTLDQELDNLRARNKAVESHKAWEVSLFRRLILTLFIYIAAYLVMWIIAVEKVWMASLVPAVGYFLSTLTVTPLREWWIKRFYR